MSLEMPLPTLPMTSTSTSAATPETPHTVPASTAAQPALPQTVSIPLDQLNAFTAMQARLAKVEEEQARREAAAREEQVKILAAKGQVEEALRTQREEAQRALEAERVQRAQVEERAKCYALDGELARALGSQPLVAGGAEQLTHLLRDHFVVEPQGNSFQVRTQDFRSVGDYIGAMLGRPEYAHFLRAQNPAGGTGGVGGQSTPTPAGNQAPPVEPKNFSEAVLMQFQSNGGKGAADPRLTPTVPFGLRGTAAAARTG
jgi:hypothetical protein